MAKALVEQRRPWMVLCTTDTSKSVTTANIWQTAIAASPEELHAFIQLASIRLWLRVKPHTQVHLVRNRDFLLSVLERGRGAARKLPRAIPSFRTPNRLQSACSELLLRRSFRSLPKALCGRLGLVAAILVFEWTRVTDVYTGSFQYAGYGNLYDGTLTSAASTFKGALVYSMTGLGKKIDLA